MFLLIGKLKLSLHIPIGHIGEQEGEVVKYHGKHNFSTLTKPVHIENFLQKWTKYMQIKYFQYRNDKMEFPRLVGISSRSITSSVVQIKAQMGSVEFNWDELGYIGLIWVELCLVKLNKLSSA